MKQRVLTLCAAVLSSAFFLLGMGAATAQAQCHTLPDGSTACPAADSKCVKDRYGDWFCSAPGGDAKLDFHGNPVCGVGACVTDLAGQIQCSTQSRGAAAMDLGAKAVCTAGCVLATAAQCQKLTR